MARSVTVRLSADITAYLTAMGQAEQATSRVADAADRLSDIQISAESSVASDLDQAASSADTAASSMESASGAAEDMSGGMDSASASAQEAAGGLDTAGGAAQTAAGGMQEAGAASDDVAASVGQVSAASQDTAAAMMAVGGASQGAAGDLQSAAGAAESAGAGIETAAASAQTAAAGIDSVSGAAQSAAGDLETTSGSAQSAAGGLDDIAGSAQTAGGALDGMDSSMAGASGSASDFLGTAAGMRTEFTQLGGAMAVAGGGMTAMTGYLINVGIEYNNLQQVAGQALSTMTESAEDANAQMDRLNNFASTSPFFRDTWITAQQQLMAFGMEAEQVVPTLEGIEEAVAAIGGGDQEIRRLVDILGQVQGQGRITGRELQRMGQMGIDAASIIGDHMGMTGDEIREQITAGALDAETAIEALSTGMSTRFEGSADAVRNTFQGATNDVIAFTRDIGSIIASPLVNPEGGGFLVDIANMAGDTLLSLRDLPDPLIQIAGLGAAAAGGITLLGGGLVAALPHLRNFATNAGTAWSAIGNFATGGGGVAGGIRRIGTAAGIAAGAFVAWQILDGLSSDVDEFASSVSEMRQQLIRLSDGENAFENVQWTRADEGRESIDGLGEAMERVSTGGVQGFNDAANRMFSSILPVSSAIDDLDENFANLDESISGAFSDGDFTYAAAGFQEVAEEAELLGWTAEEVAEHYPQMTDAIRDAATAAETSATDQQLLGIATSEAALAALHAGEDWSTITQAYQDNYYAASDAGEGALSFRDALSQQAEAAGEADSNLSDLLGSMGEYAGIALSAEETTDQWLASLRELDEAIQGEADAIAELDEAYQNGLITQEEYDQGVQDATFSLDRNTDAGAENRAMLRGIAEDTWEAAAAAAAEGESLEEVNGVIDTNIEALREAGEAAGLTEGEIDDMIRTYMGFNDVEPIEVQAENRAQEIFDEVEEGLNSLPDDFTIWLEAQDERAQETIAALLEGDYEAVADITGDDALAQAVIEAFESGDYRAVAELIAEDDDAQSVIYDFENGEYVAQVDILGNPDEANQILAAVMNGDYDAIVDILGEDVDASAVIEAVETGDYEALVGILGDDELAREVINSFTETPRITTVDTVAETGNAEDALNETSRDRIADVLAEPDAWNAEGVLTDTARDRIADILADSDTGIAESDLNGTARQRIADILGEPHTYTAEGELTDTARQRIADILADPHTWDAESDLNDTSRPRNAPVTAEAHTWGAESSLNNLTRTRDAIIRVGVSGASAAGSIVSGILGSGATGGRAGSLTSFKPLPAFSTGGRLPSTGLGTDSILGISRSGIPTAWVDDREHIINQQSSDKYDGILTAINSDLPSVRHLAGYADGGRAGTVPRSVVEHAAPRQPVMAAPAAQQAASGPIQVEVSGELQSRGNTMVAVVRNAMKDDDVVRTARQSFHEQSQQDRMRG